MPLAREPNDRPSSRQDTSTDALSVGQMLALWDDADPETRRKAAQGFIRAGGEPAALCAHLEEEGNLAVIETAMTALADAGGETVVALLVDLLRSENASLRVQVVTALQALPVETAPHIDALLVDPDPDVRILAANILQEFPDKRTNGWLLSLVRTDPHVNVCMAAVEALAETGTPDMVDDLNSLTHRFPHHPFVRSAVAHVSRLIDGRSDCHDA